MRPSESVVTSTWFCLVVALATACGNSGGGGAGVGAGGSMGGDAGSSGAGATGGSSAGQGGAPDLIGDGGEGNSSSCQPTTCEALGKDCGAVADGCGDIIECGSCGAGEACGIVTSNVCTAFEELCVPALASEVCAGKECGVEGDGCGGVIDCGTCGAGEACGVEQPFQCGAVLVSNESECPARIESCEAAGAECGVIGNGCGGTLDCGGCGAGELCGLNEPFVCGSAPVCEPLDAATACAGKCGLVSNGCGSEVSGGVIDCQALFPCPDGETCGGGGVPNACGSGGSACQPIPQGTACSGLECGVASDGCGSSYVCGTCSDGETCRAGQCEAPACTPLSQSEACGTRTCGRVGDGCGGTYGCGTCLPGEQCGLVTAFQCGALPPSECQALTQEQACAGKECGTALDGCGTGPGNTYTCGACADGEFCGLVEPFQCDAPVVPPCESAANSCAELGWACGLAINECGEVFDCADEGRTCSAFETCTGGTNGGVTVCTGGAADCELCDAVPTCPEGSPTRLTGRVITPGRTDGNTPNQVGVPNAFVYILRNNDTSDLPDIATGIPSGGTSCDRCSEQDLGPVLASAITDADGSFTLSGNIPVDTPFLLVTKAGKFRRAVTHQVSSSVQCQTSALATTMPNNPTRLPRSLSDTGVGINIPRIAISTGRIDAMECVFEKMGIASSVFTRPQLGGRIHLYRADGAWPDQQSADCNACGTSTSTTDQNCRSTNCGGSANSARTSFLAAVSDASLQGSQTTLNGYDMVVFDCEGTGWDSSFAQRDANGAKVREYVNRGGRMFASHLSFSWLHQNGTTAYSEADPFVTGLGPVASWDTNFTASGNLDSSGTGVISLGRPRASPRIQNFADWMVSENVTSSPGFSFTITDPRSLAVVDSLGTSSEEFVFRSDGNGRVQQFSFDTPYAAPEADSCGRVAYSGFHVAATGGGTQPFINSVFPAHCSGNLTSQEKVLLYMLFDLGACVGEEPTPPACVPVACPTDGTCGTFPDGCGGQLDCGCEAGEACIENQCVVPGCVPTTCEDEGVICSSISDGCGGVLECSCDLCVPLSQQDACAGVTCGTASDGCSDVYVCSQCPDSCVPLTECPAQFDCGIISDGCDGSLDCGDCEAGELCGANAPNVCGTPQCEPLTCEDVGATCGMIGDGCGGAVDCGTCPPGQSCTIAGGIPNQCAGCQPRSCEDAGAECGLIGDGCGGTADCGVCPEGTVCGAQAPNQCGSGPECPPLTCEAAGAQCGIIGDGCGGQVDCGPCPAGQLCGVETPFQCGTPPACAPRTCASAGAECGAVGDGCGGVLTCGACPEGSVCGLASPNRCASIR